MRVRPIRGFCRYRQYLSPGREYDVLGLNDEYYRVVDDQGEPILFPRFIFKITDDRIPEDWVWQRFSEGEYHADPPGMNRPGFYEDYFDGKPEAIEFFWAYVRRVAGLGPDVGRPETSRKIEIDHDQVDTMTVAQSIELMKREGSRLAVPVPVPDMPDIEFDCHFADTRETESGIVAKVPDCPPDLVEFWKIASSARLFENRKCNEWGLEIFDPATAVSAMQKFQEQRKRDFREGDLVLGKFNGGFELLVIRCDGSSPDFGHLYVTHPLDPRNAWHRVGSSLALFLDDYVKTGGEKFWTPS